MEAVVADSSAVAVLPCTILSGDPAEECVSGGHIEAVIGAFSRVRALPLRPSTSASASKRQDRDLRKIGEALNVGSRVEHVRRLG